MLLAYFKFKKVLKVILKFKNAKNATNLNLGKYNGKSERSNKYTNSKTFGKISEVYNFNNVFRKVVSCYKQPSFLPYSEIRMNCTANKNFKRHVYCKDIEDALNEQISEEFKAMFTYLSMACYFGRTDVALPGCYGFFMIMHEEEHDHALRFINYQNLRGGKVVLKDVKNDQCKEWNLQLAFTSALELEKNITEKLLYLNDLAKKHNDTSVKQFIGDNYITEQEQSICQMSRLLMRLNRMGNDGIAEYFFDKELHNAYVKKSDKLYFPNRPGDNAAGKNKYL